MMQYFRQDNTEGYTDEELAELNRRFEQAVAEAGLTDLSQAPDKSTADAIAERILADFDIETA